MSRRGGCARAPQATRPGHWPWRVARTRGADGRTGGVGRASSGSPTAGTVDAFVIGRNHDWGTSAVETDTPAKGTTGSPQGAAMTAGRRRSPPTGISHDTSARRLQHLDRLGGEPSSNPRETMEQGVGKDPAARPPRDRGRRRHHKHHGRPHQDSDHDGPLDGSRDMVETRPGTVHHPVRASNTSRRWEVVSRSHRPDRLVRPWLSARQECSSVFVRRSWGRRPISRPVGAVRGVDESSP